MNDGPFLESSQTTRHRARKPFLVEQCQHYSLSAMAIVFGIGIVLSGLIITVAVLVIHFSFLPSPVVGYSGAAIWFVFSVWLWFSLVSIGKVGRESRVSDAELIAIQALFFLSLFGEWIFASGRDKAILHQIGLASEWCVIAFHILYFLLALCVWVRLPLRSYIVFAIMLAVALFQTVR